MNESYRIKSMSFFCPAYYDALNLPELIPSVFSFLKKHCDEFEILIIVDCSPDNTLEVANNLAMRFPYVRVISHKKNRGITATMKEGFESAKYDFIMYTDGDNQYDVWDLEPHIALLGSSDVLSGYATKKAVSAFRRFQSWLYNSFIKMLFLVNFKDINCSMKIYSKEVLNKIEIESSPKGGFIDAEMILKANRLGFKISQFPVVHYERMNGVAGGTKPIVTLNTIKDMVLFRLGLL